MKTFLLSGVAAALLAGTALAAQAPVAQTQPPMQVQSRAAVSARVQQQFARLDADRDGAITQAEIQARGAGQQARLAARQAKRAERQANRAGGAFDRFDANHDGSISRAEFDSVRQQRGQRAGQLAQRRGNRFPGARMTGPFGGRMFAMADSNKDGRVTLQEAQSAALQRFDRVDANRDGQITPQERQQLRQQMRAQQRPQG